MPYEIKPYSPDCASTWNKFVKESRQGTFLFDRQYMGYHSDRFADSSLMVFHHGKVRALLPANIKDDTLFSHGGLTYGGLLTDKKLKVADIEDIFQAINQYLKTIDVHRVVYKAIPWIYHRLPAEEDLYALYHVCNARLICREISSSIILSNRLPFEESRKSGIRKAARCGITCSEDDDMASFWNILDENLVKNHHTHPVHTLAELNLLKSRFPDNIRLFMAKMDGMPVGGTLIYDTGQVIHTQYISATEEGKRSGALDALFDYIINKVYADRLYLDFGKSTEDGGRYLNRNLIFQKEGFGGRGVCYDTYEYLIQ